MTQGLCATRDRRSRLVLFTLLHAKQRKIAWSDMYFEGNYLILEAYQIFLSIWYATQCIMKSTNGH